MSNLIFVTKNKNKGIEIQEKFSFHHIPVEIVEMDFQEPEVNDIMVVSKSKVMQAYQMLGKPCFVIDSGFNIFHYPNNPGYPGAFVRRSGIAENIDQLLETMKDVKDRSCCFLDCLTFYDGTEFFTFYGINEGTLTYEKRGFYHKTMRSPLWYVFQPLECSKTLAEMSPEERDARKVGHVSAKEQFLQWYVKNYCHCQKLEKKFL